MTDIPIDITLHGDPAVAANAAAQLLLDNPKGDWTEGTDADLAFALAGLLRIADAVKERVRWIEQAMVDRLEVGQVATSPTGERFRKAWTKGSASWNDKDETNRVIQAQIAARVSTDLATGEVDIERRALANATFQWVLDTWTLPPPRTGRDSGMRRLRLDPREHRTFGFGHAKIEKVPSEAV